MDRTRATLVGLAVLAAGAAGFVARGFLAGDTHPAPTPHTGDPAPIPPGHTDEIALPERIRWIAMGGGADPASNQVSLEQDLALAREAFGSEGGVLLHAGGHGIDGVQVLDPSPERDPLLHRLGHLLDPAERTTRYRPSELDGAGPATADHALTALAAALEEGDAGPLLFYFTGHGELGHAPAENVVRAWGGWGITPIDLAGAIEDAESERAVVVVIAACFSGGFGTLAFEGADPDAGRAARNRCGLFASTWERESGGCDPNPERGEQEGFSMHFLRALRGQDRDGQPLPADALDYDGDGAISFLEAHTRARVESGSVDVPTTTSEAWLRHAAPDEGPSSEVSLPEDDVVIEVLGERLELDSAEATAVRLAALGARLDSLDVAAAELDDVLDERWADLRIGLLERWPVLDDPWHPTFADTLERNRVAITAWLDDSREAVAWGDASRARREHDQELGELLVTHAGVERLHRAHENVALASRLRALGGPGWEAFEALLACERQTIPAR